MEIINEQSAGIFGNRTSQTSEAVLKQTQKKSVVKRFLGGIAFCACLVWVITLGIYFLPSFGSSNTNFTLTFMDGNDIFETVTLPYDAPVLNMDYIPTRPDSYFTGWFIDANCSVAFNAASFVSRDTTIYAGFKDYADAITDYVRNTGTYQWSQEPMLVNYNAEERTVTADYTLPSILTGNTLIEYSFTCNIRTGEGSLTATLQTESSLNGELVTAGTVLQSVTFNAPLKYTSVALGGSVKLAKFEIVEFIKTKYMNTDEVKILAENRCYDMVGTVDEILWKHFKEKAAGIVISA